MSINKRQADLMLFIVAILWGSSYVFAKLTVEAGMHSGLINACRGTMCVLAGGLIFFKKIRHMTWVDFRLGLVIGTINFLGYYLQTDALRYTSEERLLDDHVHRRGALPPLALLAGTPPAKGLPFD